MTKNILITGGGGFMYATWTRKLFPLSEGY